MGATELALDNAVVALVVELRNSGLAYPVIADRLNELGISTERGRAWTDHNVSKVAVEAGIPTRAKAAPRPTSTGPSARDLSGPRVLTEAQREAFTSPRKAADVERQIAARFATEDEVAHLLQIPPVEVWNLARAGQVPSSFCPQNGVRRYPRAAVEALAAERAASMSTADDNDECAA